MQLLRIRIQVISDQIGELERQLTSNDGRPGERGGLGQDHAIRRTRARTPDRGEAVHAARPSPSNGARINAERQKVYLTTFVTPLLPHDVAWPRHRFRLALAGLLAVAGLYWFGTLVTSLSARPMIRSRHDRDA